MARISSAEHSLRHALAQEGKRREFVSYRRQKEMERLAEVKRQSARHQLLRVEKVMGEQTAYAQVLLGRGEEVPPSVASTIEFLINV